jgi:putative oxidoreductase
MSKKYAQWAPLVLRLIIGFGFMQHGWAKLSRGTAGFEKLLVLTGVPFAHINSWVAPLVELLGGFAIFVGAFTFIVSMPLIITMLVAMFTIQLNFGFSSVKTIGLSPTGPLFGPPGYEINLLYIAGLISLMLTGSGKLSMDIILARKKA